MISLKDRLSVSQLRKKINEIRGEYESDIKEAIKNGKSRDDIENIICEMNGCCEYDEYEIEKIITKELIKESKRHFIELPDKIDEKIWDNTYWTYILTDHGKSIISKQIKNHRREDYEFILKIISVLTGFVGVLIGLVAMLKK